MGKRTFVFFAFAFLLTSLVTAPASLLDKFLQYATHGRLALANTSGTVWNGAATPALRTQEGHFIVLQALHWIIDPISPFTGKLKIQLRWDDMPAIPVMDAVISPKQIALHHARIPLPAQVLSEAVPALKPVQFRGQLQIQSDYLAFSAHGTEGSVSVDWQQAGSALSSISPLGNYRLALNGAGDRININLTTVSGIMLLEGQGNWLAGRGLEFHGKAQASAEGRDSLTELLQHLGPEESPGVHSFNLTPQ